MNCMKLTDSSQNKFSENQSFNCLCFRFSKTHSQPEGLQRIAHLSGSYLCNELHRYCCCFVIYFISPIFQRTLPNSTIRQLANLSMDCADIVASNYTATHPAIPSFHYYFKNFLLPFRFAVSVRECKGKNLFHSTKSFSKILFPDKDLTNKLSPKELTFFPSRFPNWECKDNRTNWSAQLLFTYYLS